MDVPGPKLDTIEVRGEQLTLEDRGVKFTLFVPRGSTNATNVTVHFHTIASSVIPAHARRDSTDPLLVFIIGSGSSAYRVPFEDTNRFARIISITERELRARGSTSSIARVDISSFSAGYGAVRELIKSPTYFPMIRRVVLLDSIYGSLVTNVANRAAAPEHAHVWVPLARSAMRGEKTFVITLSDIVPATFASTLEVTSALLDRVGLKFQPVTPSQTNDYALISRVDSGNFHVWRYAGSNGLAHITHAQHMAEVWRAIERR